MPALSKCPDAVGYAVMITVVVSL